MNWKILIAIIVVLVGVVLFIIFSGKTKSTKELEITYKKSAGIPFKTVYEIEDESIVQFVKSYVSKDENTGAKTGAAVYTNYVFKGIREGETTITIKSVSIENDNDFFNEKVTKVKVDQDNNISVVKESE